MASTSTPTSSIQKSFKYDVFLSFRGEDTRKNFVDHLYNALKQKGIETYKDDEKIRKGKTINEELIQAIEDSKFYIIVFSKNYASSSWCLDELVKIMECQKMSEHTAYPVFLDVEPSEVRKQNGVVEVAFAKHINDKSAGEWREALKQAADLAGWELKNIFDGHEAKLIQKIVEEISLELRYINSGVDENLIGMKTRIDDVVSSLELGVDDVRMIGIKGMGGAGKTTLARAVYEHISFQFEGCSFVENVREESTPMSRLKLLQKQILSDVFSDQGITVNGVLEGKNMLKKKMCGKKVLIVLDDVDKIEQLVALAGDCSWFKRGSRIVITTRDAQVLIPHKVNLIHDIHLLTDTEAICLFSRHAFGRDIPIEGYKKLSEQVVRYAAGLPLTIRVLGSFLCGKDDIVWKDALKRLKTIPLNETMKVLELSYFDLEEDYKEIFLDVACLLKGWEKDDAIRALESSGFHARSGLRVLEHRSLITISHGFLRMHDHIEEMGMNIVRRLNPNEPNKHSRLWIKKEISDILANDSGTQATKCIRLNARGFNFKILMNGLANMKELRFLRVYAPYVSEAEVRNWSFGGVDLCLPNALRFLQWSNYPFSSLPKTFQAKDLVGLEMLTSNIVQLWKHGEEKVFSKLRFVKFRNSKLRILDLGQAPNLEVLYLDTLNHLVKIQFPITPNLKELHLSGCLNLKELHMPAETPKLRFLKLFDSKLMTLRLGITSNLKTLKVYDCTDMVELQLPTECPKLKNLELCDLNLTTLDLGITPNLETLSLYNCTNMVKLKIPAECPKLVNLELCDLKLMTLDLGILPNLKTLSLHNCTDMVELQISVECSKLVKVELSDLKLTTLRLDITPNLEVLSIHNCTDMVKLHIPVECSKLVKLILSNLKLTTLRLGITPNLETLTLHNCTDMVELQIPAECSKLVNLTLSNLKLRTLDFGIIPNLETLSMYKCTDMVELHIPAKCPKLVNLELSYLKLTTLSLGITLNLETLSLDNCTEMVELQIPTECPKLITLDLRYLKLTSLHLGITPKLETLSLKDCCNLVELHLPFRCLKLKNLSLNGSKLRNLQLGLTPDLETLSLAGCDSLAELHMPFGCPKLIFLSLRNTKLSTLDLGLTPNLQTLDLKECHGLVEINTPIGCLKTLRYIDLTDCGKFESFLIDKRFLLVDVNSLSELYVTVESFDVRPLHSENNSPKSWLTSFYIRHPVLSVGSLKKLICVCNLEISTVTIRDFQCLRKLTLKGSIPKVPEFVVQLEGLEELILLSTKIKHLPESISLLKNLKILELKSCLLLEKLPENLGALKCLEKLILTECVLLRDIPNSIFEMKCLKELDITGTGISRLPESIFRVKGLRIVGSRWLLESCGFTSEIKTSDNETYCYIEIRE